MVTRAAIRARSRWGATWSRITSACSSTLCANRSAPWAAALLENLGGSAGDADQELAVGAEIDRPLHHAQVLPLRSVDIGLADAGRRQLNAALLELRQLLVPERTGGAHLGLLRVGAGDLPIPARQRQLEQRLPQRLKLTVGRLVGGGNLRDQGAEIEVEPAVEGAFGRIIIDRGQR